MINLTKGNIYTIFIVVTLEERSEDHPNCRAPPVGNHKYEYNIQYVLQGNVEFLYTVMDQCWLWLKSCRVYIPVQKISEVVGFILRPPT